MVGAEERCSDHVTVYWPALCVTSRVNPLLRSTNAFLHSLDMAEIAIIRAEIKQWERTFKDENGRNPTVQDIKEDPVMRVYI